MQCFSCEEFCLSTGSSLASNFPGIHWHTYCSFTLENFPYQSDSRNPMSKRTQWLQADSSDLSNYEVWILLRHLVNAMNEPVDPHQSAHKQGCGAEDAVTTLNLLIARHLDKPRTYAKELFLDFSSAFNTIQTNLLLNKIIQQKINPFLIHWYASFQNQQNPTESR